MVGHEVIFYEGKKPSRQCLFCAPPSEMILAETEHFRLLADTYPITAGQIMISSKLHYSAGGELASQLHEEFVEMKHRASRIVKAMGDSCIFYEHGKAGSCHSHASETVHCEHFHMHCLPASICIHSKIARHFQSLPMESITDLFSYYPKYGSYLFFENADGVMQYTPVDEGNVPSHFLRTLICEALHVKELANWEAYTDLNRSLQSRQRIALAMQKDPVHALL